MVQSVDRDRVDGADHLQHAVEVVELLEHLQDLDDARQHGHSLLQVHRLYDAPASHADGHSQSSHHDPETGLSRLARDSLLEPQREVGGVADHAQQVGRVLLFVFFGPDAADQLGRPDGSVKGGGGAYYQRDTALNLCD